MPWAASSAELDWAVGMGTDQIAKRYWAVTVRVYRDSTILGEMNSNVINLASKSQQVPDACQIYRRIRNSILIESGNYTYPTSLYRFKLTDYYTCGRFYLLDLGMDSQWERYSIHLDQ